VDCNLKCQERSLGLRGYAVKPGGVLPGERIATTGLPTVIAMERVVDTGHPIALDNIRDEEHVLADWRRHPVIVTAGRGVEAVATTGGNLATAGAGV